MRTGRTDPSFKLGHFWKTTFVSDCVRNWRAVDDETDNIYVFDFML
jgi:hypothetical protein